MLTCMCRGCTIAYAAGRQDAATAVARFLLDYLDNDVVLDAYNIAKDANDNL